ncbi:carbonic anhydrase [Bathymodiolus platifrons methanotrophic gill symbiont]|nr:carbonic anhydrase [Methylococcaceae bacterium CS4]TXL04934.1 carbonic anhydrase [Methylococcaceae bacterium CS1]TXL10598.1 carbonic anhydrase [Methylococcaceae bacterium CS2]TXL19425.1 carbonic anhydrase [Methylococcaceae bacterium HT5]GAW85661.1 carbonic anhydrase [Bathymodiolus platifrons methanotrophic gill symbiont]
MRNSFPIMLLIAMVVAGCAEYKVPIAIDKEQHSNQESYFIPGLDHGLIQSPINILSAEIKASKGHGITLHFQDKINAIKNLGYTVQLDFDKGSTVSSDGREYELKQMHFHTPSEHLIDGMTFPMELHIVNQVPPLNESDTPHYLVIAALFKMGKENKFISEFLNKIPKQENTKAELQTGEVKLSDIFSDFLSTTPSFYHYRGSLTTKPYTESVSWFVLKRIIEASPEQIRTINKIEGDNARHIQNKFGRTID